MNEDQLFILQDWKLGPGRVRWQLRDKKPVSECVGRPWDSSQETPEFFRRGKNRMKQRGDRWRRWALCGKGGGGGVPSRELPGIQRAPD